MSLSNQQTTMSPRIDWPVVAVVANLVWLFYSVLMFSEPQTPLLTGVAWLFATMGLGLIWTGLWLTAIVSTVRARSLTAIWRGTLMMFPLAVLLTAIIAWSELPLRTRFALSEEQLNELATDVRDAPVLFTAPHQAGLFRVKRAFPQDACVYLVTGEIFPGGGFARCNRPPIANSRLTHHHLSGDWWVWNSLSSD
jgi:hypothetical protein